MQDYTDPQAQFFMYFSQPLGQYSLFQVHFEFSAMESEQGPVAQISLLC